MMAKPTKILITTAIDYANATIHVGHAYEKVLADAIARYYRKLLGSENVFFVTGTDEHGTSTYEAAQKIGESVEEFTQRISLSDKDQVDSLNISYNRFIRTTDADHQKTASELFSKALKTGAVYKGKYEGFYCEGCEAYKTLSDLNENGQCPNHPNRQIQKLEEENYFFRWGNFEGQLRELLSQPNFVLPTAKRNEMLSFLNQGLQDVPVSRPKYKVPWGIPVPGDPDQIIYVWYDALTNYYTAGHKIGFWEKDTKIVHFVGKDILRFHTLLWPAMLMNLDLPLPTTVYAHGFVNLEGRKISKSLGNVIYPLDLVKKYGVDAVRYYLLKYGPIIDDTDISISHFEQIYNSELANGLGNTVARIAKLAQNSRIPYPVEESEDFEEHGKLWDEEWARPLAEYRVDLTLQNIWNLLSQLDKHINEHEPWAEKNPQKLCQIVKTELNSIRRISRLLEPFMPDTSKKIWQQLGKEIVTTGNSLFPKL